MNRKLVIILLFIILIIPVRGRAGESEEKIRGLIKQLSSNNPDVRYMAVQELAPLREPESYQHLMNLGIRDRDHRVRRAAIYALGLLGDNRAVSFLLSALKRDELMPVAAMALGRIGDPAAIMPLIENLKKWDGCVLALVKIGKPAVLPLIGSLKSQNDRTRMLSARTLGLIGDRRALKPLMDAREDQNRWVRSEIDRAVESFKD